MFCKTAIFLDLLTITATPQFSVCGVDTIDCSAKVERIDGANLELFFSDIEVEFPHPDYHWKVQLINGRYLQFYKVAANDGVAAMPLIPPPLG
jgi:hypothetical protein